MKALDHLEEWLIAFLMGAATIVIFVAVVHRYASGIPWPAFQDWLLTVNLSWAQELCIYMFIWMAKFGAAYGVRTGIHVGVDVLINRLNDTWRKGVILFGLAGGALFGRYLADFADTYVTYYAGLASAMIALVFLYYSACIFLYGGELNAVLRRFREFGETMPEQ